MKLRLKDVGWEKDGGDEGEATVLNETGRRREGEKGES